MYNVTIAGKECGVWAEVLDHTAMEQFRSAMECDFAIKGALMADAHAGYALPIGSVVAAADMVIPAWVGYDIGCGMTSYKLDGETELLSEHREAIKQWMYDKGLLNGQQKHLFNMVCEKYTNKLSEIGKDKVNSYGGVYNFGTLGGGNHFAEIGKEDNNQYWITIHSGSRDLGRAIGDVYMRLAAKEAGYTDGKPHEGHHGFHAESFYGKCYIRDMNVALEFALASRIEVVDRIVLEVNKCLHSILDTDGEDYITGELVVNRNHNHAELTLIECHETDDNGVTTSQERALWIHRKGTTHASDGMLGVIPGNMRDGVFIVEGKGDVEALYSSSHGAGRVMSRGEAKVKIDLEKFEETMTDAGISAKVSRATLDEAPEAYKNIFDVMDAQEDLVEVKHYVVPVINLKG